MIVSPSESTVAATLKQALEWHQQGRREAAEQGYRQVLERQPGHADALHLLGLCAYQSGRVAEAVALIRRSLRKRPDFAPARVNLAHALLAGGRLADARQAYTAALADRRLALEQQLEAHVGLGRALLGAGDGSAAEHAFRAALELRPAYAQGHLGLGDALYRQERFGPAIVACQQAIALAPELAAAHNSLGIALQAECRYEEALAAHRRATEIDPTYAGAFDNAGLALRWLQRPEEAVQAHRRVLELQPDHAPARVNLGNVYRDLGRTAAACEVYTEAIARQPDFAPAHCFLAGACLEAGRPQAALAAAEACLALEPVDRTALAYKGAALEQCGDRPAARRLVNFETLIARRYPKPPSRYHGLEEFNRALVDVVLHHPTLAHERTPNSTRNGRHTGELLGAVDGPVAELTQRINEAVADYLQKLPREPNHPFLAHAMTRWRLVGWSVVMDNQGHQICHIHPGGWISGCYYVQVPGVISAEDAQQAGWIEFGRPPSAVRCAVEPEVLCLPPEEGLMYLFPSYFYHRTIPFESEVPRICIAFDAMPVE